jgi:hypothetical protein
MDTSVRCGAGAAVVSIRVGVAVLGAAEPIVAGIADPPPAMGGALETIPGEVVGPGAPQAASRTAKTSGPMSPFDPNRLVRDFM